MQTTPHTCPICSLRVTGGAPSILLHERVSHSGAVPIIEVPTVEKVLELTQTLQSWRPESLTREFYQFARVPFCTDCADWHPAGDTHSSTDLDH